MSQVITNAFEQYWQSSLAAEQPVVLDEFILADIPNLDITSPIDPDAGLPPESQIVHRQNVDQRGRINNNAVAYTIVMDTTVGDFSFNAMYLRNKQNGVIGMIVYKGRETKLKTDQTTGQTGNSLVKSMLMGYDQAAEATLTHVDAGTWQIDYAARLRGQDEDLRQLASQLYGHHTFIGDGFKVVQQAGGHQVTPGVAIVGGLRIELNAPEVIYPGSKPIGVWVDVYRAGSLLSEHQNHFTIITSVTDLADHVDSSGYQHYVAKLGTVQADGSIEDGRSNTGDTSIPDALARLEAVDDMLDLKVWEALRRSYEGAGLTLRPYPESFKNGGTLTTATSVLLHEESCKAYSGTGPFPQDVDQNTNPLDGGFVDRSGELLFDISYSASVEAKNATTDFNIIIGDKPLPFTASKRDAYQVSRYLDGKTDCHAFADKTEIREISDSGTYGTFDSQTVITHDGVQNHQFSFQDRARYEGGGTLSSWGNIIWPEMIGSGHVTQRTDIEIKDVGGAGGSIAAHIGLYIRDLYRATSNVAINIAQSSGFSLYAPYDGATFAHVGNVTFGGVSTDPNIKLRLVEDSATNTVALNIAKNNGHAIYSPGTGKTYLNGNVGIGVLPGETTPLLVGTPGFTSQFFVANNAAGVSTGAVGDYQYNLVCGAANRLSILPSLNGYAVVPGGNGTQSLGSPTNRWSEVFAANATINTSDAREKQQVSALSDDERRVAARIKDLFVTFKFNRAVEQKGDGARIHVGVIAQDVQAAFLAEGLDPHRYSLFCFDEWSESSDEVETTEDDPDAYAKAVEVQKTETVTVAKRRIEIHGDTAVQIEYTEQVEQPVHATFPVCDEAGTPILNMISPYDELTGADAVYRQETIEVPVMETQTRYYKRVTRPAGGLYGIRYEELLAFVIAAM